MKVFIVLDDIAYEGSSIVSVFDSLDKARAFVKEHQDDTSLFFGHARIEQWEGMMGMPWDEQTEQFLGW